MVLSSEYSSCSANKYKIIQKYKLEDSFSCTPAGLSWSLKTAFKILALSESRIQDKSLNLEDVVLLPTEKRCYLTFSQNILRLLLKRNKNDLRKMKAYQSNQKDQRGSWDRMDLVHALLNQENEMLTNALAMLE